MSVFEPIGQRFFDVLSGREMILVNMPERPDIHEWVCYRHPDGQWVTLRRATEDDKQKLVAAARLTGK